MQKDIKVIQKGKFDFMGFAWFSVAGTKIKALDSAHAIRIYNQLKSIQQ